MAFLQNFLSSAFWFLVVVGILVFLHEAGHFLTAKAFGMKVEAFALGFGKRLFGRRRGETDYRVNLIPLGGYVKLAGGEDGAASPKDLPPDYFLARPRWQRFLVLVMGATVNVALAVFLFTLAFVLGVEVPRSTKPVVYAVEEGSAAAEAGLATGDRIVRVGGKQVEGWADVATEIFRAGRRPVELELARGEAGETAVVTLVPRFDRDGRPDIGARGGAAAIVSKLEPDMPGARAGLREDDQIEAIDGRPVGDFTEVAQTIHGAVGRELLLAIRRGAETFEVRVTPVQHKLPDGREVGRIGFTFKMPVEFVKLAPLPALRRGVSMSLDLAGSLFHVLKNLVTRNQPFATLAGPIEIAKESRSSAERGTQFLMWMAFISLQLGIINLLPIPALDGGHIFILLSEGILRRDLSMELKERLTTVGAILLLVLMAAVLLQDILKNLPKGLFRNI